MSSVGIIEIVVSVLVAGLVITRQVRARPLSMRSMLLLPVIMGIIGATELAKVKPLTGTDWTWVSIDLAVAVASGLARGPSVHLFDRDGVLWRQGGRSTVLLWVISIAARVVVTVLGGHHGAARALGHGLLLSFGVSLATQYLVIAVRASRTGLPFAPSQRSSDRVGTAR